jgi:mono/diheme cytochrome c family protein
VVNINKSVFGVFLLLIASVASVEEPLPYQIEYGKVDQSTYLGWRIFHSTCHGCHGIDATGTTVAPNLVEAVSALSAREFTIKVLTRYRINVSSQAAGSDDKTEMRDEFLRQVMRRQSGELLMPAWEKDANVKPHILDLYAYLRARADGALAPGRPKKKPQRELKK